MVDFDRISTPRKGFVVSPSARVSRMDAIPSLKTVFSAENCARFPSQLWVMSDHLLASKESKLSSQAKVNLPAPAWASFVGLGDESLLAGADAHAGATRKGRHDQNHIRWKALRLRISG